MAHISSVDALQDSDLLSKDAIDPVQYVPWDSFQSGFPNHLTPDA